MQKIVLRYGLYATLFIVALSALEFFVLNDLLSSTLQEVSGYLTMLLSMVFVFFGLKQYRDKYNNGQLSFGKGMKIGILIVLIPSVAFGLFDLLYTEVLHPGWVDEYYTNYIAKLKASTPPGQLEAALKKANEQKEMFSNPLLQFLLMSVTVFIIGLIVTIIAALTLRRNKPVEPAPIHS
jgi:heme/copper-type cytochrome/quinol oxidase subunit 2